MVTDGNCRNPHDTCTVTECHRRLNLDNFVFQLKRGTVLRDEESWQRWPWIWLDLKSLANLSIPVLWGLDKSCWRRVHKVARWSKQVKSQLGQCPLGQFLHQLHQMKLQGQTRDKKKGITLVVHLEQYCGILWFTPGAAGSKPSNIQPAWKGTRAFNGSRIHHPALRSL